MDRAGHLRMIGAAELGAFELEIAELRRLEPERFVGARHCVVLHAKCRNVEAVNDVLGAEQYAHSLAERKVKRVDLALAARILRLPHPLLADDVELEIGLRRLVKIEIGLRAEGE